MSAIRYCATAAGRVAYSTVGAGPALLCDSGWVTHLRGQLELSADVWHPDEALAESDGHVRPEFLWAALDCAGGIGAFGNAVPNGPPFVLGRRSARQLGPVRARKPYIVVGWRLAEEGRKMIAGSALFTADGQAVGVARATWIRLG